MTNKSQEFNLNNLWQQQSEIAIDAPQIAELAKMAKRQQLKQRIYMAIDIASLIPVTSLFFFFDRFTPFLKAFILFNLTAGVIMVGYFIKLRWAAVFSNHSNTKQYQENLLQQLKNNARIALVNKHIAWIALILATVVVIVNGWLINEELIKTVKKTALSFLLAGGFLIPWYFWASKRQARFEEEVSNLESQTTASHT
jgi:hypothetical protein